MYHGSIKKTEDDIQNILKRVNELTGIKESDTGLAPPAHWDLAADKQILQSTFDLCAVAGFCVNIAKCWNAGASLLCGMLVVTFCVSVTIVCGFLQPAPVAQWAKPLLIGYSACWPVQLRTPANLGSNPGLEEGFSA